MRFHRISRSRDETYEVRKVMAFLTVAEGIKRILTVDTLYSSLSPTLFFTVHLDDCIGSGSR